MKKYVAKWEGKEIVLTQDEYKILLERFDLSNFVKEENSRYFVNSISCPLCKTYLGDDCRRCPFNIYSSPASCIGILKEALKGTIEELLDSADIYENRIKLVHNIEDGKRLITLIRELLITKFKVVEE